MMDDTTLWFFGSYVVGSVVGLIFGYAAGARNAISTTIDQLVKNGFLRHRKNKDGDIEILKLNQED
jgi:hypothetical protein